MPTLKELQNAVDEKNSLLQAAISEMNTAYSNMSINYDFLKNCKYKWQLPSLGSQADVNGCDAGVIASQHPSCGSKSSCESRVKNYNSSITTYSVKTSEKNNAQSAYDQSVKALKDFTASSPDIINQAKEEEQNRKTKNIITWVVIILVVIIVLAWVYKKFIAKNK